MSALDCLAEIERAAGRPLTDDEADALLGELERRRRLKEGGGQGAREAILAAADDLATDLAVQATIAKRNKLLNMAVRMEKLDFIRASFPDDPALGLEAATVGINRPVQGARRSADAEQAQLEGHYVQGFLADVLKLGPDHWRAFVSGHLDRDIAREMWEIRDGGQPGVSGSRMAKEIAGVAHKWQEVSRLDANKAGAWIAALPGYIVRQSHDTFKIRGVPYEAWRDFILPKLGEETFVELAEGQSRDGFLKSVYTALASGVHMGNPDAVPRGTGQGAASIAKRMSQDRLLHFKSAEDWYAYNARFGSGSLRESILYGLSRMAHDTGLMRTWGPNARDTFNRVLDTLMKAEDAEGRTDLHNARKRLEDMFSAVDGTMNIPGHAMAARASGAIRAVESMAKLGAATISAFSDLPIAASETRYQGAGYLSGYADAVSGLTRFGDKAETAEALSMVGVISDMMRGSMIDRFSGADDLPGWFARRLRSFFRWNGLTWWTDHVREGIALGMAHRLALKRGQSWDALGDDLRRVLGLHGIDQGRWNLLRQTTPHGLPDGRTMLVPEAVRELPEETLRAYLESQGRGTSRRSIGRLRDELESQLRGYYVDRANYAVITPDARTRRTLLRGTHPGTVEGEVFRFWAQFKAFPFAVVQKALGREVFGRGSTSVWQALRNGNGELPGLAWFILQTTAFGYLSMAAKDLLKGKTPRDPTDPATWAAAMSQGGGAGIYGDFLFGEAKSRFGRSALETFLGPTYGAAADLFSLYSRAKEGQDLGPAALNLAIGHVPFANLFYTKMALDYLILYQAREWMSPGYLRRMERRVERENAQTFLIRPSRAVPPGGGPRALEGFRS